MMMTVPGRTKDISLSARYQFRTLDSTTLWLFIFTHIHVETEKCLFLVNNFSCVRIIFVLLLLCTSRTIKLNYRALKTKQSPSETSFTMDKCQLYHRITNKFLKVLTM